MLAKTIDYYLNEYDSLCPSDSQVGAVASAEWWAELKGCFDDLIWLYFPKRMLFYNDRFSSDYEDDNLSNIKKTFAIWLKSKKRLIDRLYVGYMADFNPLWNVDGVTGHIIETKHTGSDMDEHRGSDKKSWSDIGDLSYIGSEDDTLSGTDITEDGATTFDSQGNYVPSDKSGTQYGKKNTHNYTNRKDSKNYHGDDETIYLSDIEHKKNTTDKHLEMEIRQGNIGVTQSDKILKDAQNLYMDEIMDLWKWIVRMCINQVSYAVEGVE